MRIKSGLHTRPVAPSIARTIASRRSAVWFTTNACPRYPFPRFAHHRAAVITLVGHRFMQSLSAEPPCPTINGVTISHYGCVTFATSATVTIIAIIASISVQLFGGGDHSSFCPPRVQLPMPVRPPSFIFVMRASGSCGCIQSSLDPFALNACDPSFTNCSLVGVAMPLSPGQSRQELFSTSLWCRAARSTAAPRLYQRRRVNANRHSLQQLLLGQHGEGPVDYA